MLSSASARSKGSHDSSGTRDGTGNDFRKVGVYTNVWRRCNATPKKFQKRNQTTAAKSRETKKRHEAAKTKALANTHLVVLSLNVLQ